MNESPVTRRPKPTRTIWTTNPASELRTPELTATVGARPCFWKKRMTRVALPAVPPTSPVKALANWTTVTVRSGSVADTEPSMAIDCEIWGSWAMTAVMATHSQSAPRKTSPISATPASWATSR